MQENLTLEIYKEGEKSLKQTVLNSLSEKQLFINKKLECKNSFILLPKLQKEQELVDAVHSLLSLQDEIIGELKKLLQESKEVSLSLITKNDFFYNEMVEYQDKYFDIMLKYNKLLKDK